MFSHAFEHDISNLFNAKYHMACNVNSTNTKHWTGPSQELLKTVCKGTVPAVYNRISMFLEVMLKSKFQKGIQDIFQTSTNQPLPPKKT